MRCPCSPGRMSFVSLVAVRICIRPLHHRTGQRGAKCECGAAATHPADATMISQASTDPAVRHPWSPGTNFLCFVGGGLDLYPTAALPNCLVRRDALADAKVVSWASVDFAAMDHSWYPGANGFCFSSGGGGN